MVRSEAHPEVGEVGAEVSRLQKERLGQTSRGGSVVDEAAADISEVALVVIEVALVIEADEVEVEVLHEAGGALHEEEGVAESLVSGEERKWSS